MHAVDDSVAVAPGQRLAGRRSSPRRLGWLVVLLLALVSAQWFALAHRTLHGAGVASRPTDSAALRADGGRRATTPGLGASADATALARAFDDHPAAGGDCRRLDSLLGTDPVPAVSATPSFATCPDACPGVRGTASPAACAVLAPPARAPPPVLA